MCEYGRGLPRDDVEAYAWYSLAAAQGDGASAERRTLLVERMSAEQVQAGRARAQAWVARRGR
jgi:hypothetical protein